MNGYNFTDEVRSTLTAARKASARLNHVYVGTEHILLGLIDQKSEVLSKALRNADTTPEELQKSIESIVKSGKPSATAKGGMDIPYTSRAKKTLELAMTEARERGSLNIDSALLLVGLLREEKGIAAQVLTHVGVTLDVVRAILPIPINPPIQMSRQVGDHMMAFPVRLNPSPYVLLSGFVFAVVAIAQITRVVMRWPVSVAGFSVPVSASVVAFVVAGGFAFWALRVRRR